MGGGSIGGRAARADLAEHTDPMLDSIGKDHVSLISEEGPLKM